MENSVFHLQNLNMPGRFAVQLVGMPSISLATEYVMYTIPVGYGASRTNLPYHNTYYVYTRNTSSNKPILPVEGLESVAGAMRRPVTRVRSGTP